jgi:hypothetical protein
MLDPELVRGQAGLLLRRASAAVTGDVAENVPGGDRDVVDGLSLAGRDVAVAVGEAAEEEDLDPFGDVQRPVLRYLDGDVGLL